MTRCLVSGIQPSGNFHIGNYYGAIKNWINLQKQTNDSKYFFIADLHSLTQFKSPLIFTSLINKSIIALLACGLDPSKITFFQQSKVPEHLELYWIFNCLTTLARLHYMPVWKTDTSQNNSDKFDFSSTNQTQNLGLFTYPILQAADILLYKATDVPIGEDQIQHLQLSQHIVQKFNTAYNINYFPTPNPILSASGARIKSLRQPSQKMSKSDPNSNNRIDLIDSPEVIRRKINRAFTDSNIPEGKFMIDLKDESLKDKPGIFNLFTIYLALVNDTDDTDNIKQVNKMEFSSIRAMKEEIADRLIQKFEPIRLRILDNLSNDNHENGNNLAPHVQKIMSEGIEKARMVANQNIQEIKKIVGLL